MDYPESPIVKMQILIMNGHCLVFQYGFVFGIANLAAFLFAPIFGRYGSKIGPKILYNCGAFLQGICGLCFGFLTYIEGANLFIGLSYLLR